MKLVAFFSLDAERLPQDRVGLTHKIVEGLELTARHWPGRMTAVFAPRTQRDTNLDHDTFALKDLSFDVEVRDMDPRHLRDVVKGADLVQLGVDHRHIAIGRLCRSLGVPYVMVGEYSLKTRLQIASVEEGNLSKRARRMAWEVTQEALVRPVIAAGAGVQCNGTPSFEAWGRLSKSALLYFDSRVMPSMLATHDDTARRGRDPVLQLAYSGRLIPMKGVQHLPDIARRLRDRGVRFLLRVWGGGPLEGLLRERIAALGLGEHMRLEGTVPFTELMRLVTRDVDVFVCPHVQGDPSCTYIETLSCGVPIAGFDNEAWRGLHERSRGGWLAPLGDARALADVIVDAEKDRAEISSRAARGLSFARDHTFDLTFERRVKHLEQVARAHAEGLTTSLA